MGILKKKIIISISSNRYGMNWLFTS